jgi:hypothetical protein
MIINSSTMGNCFSAVNKTELFKKQQLKAEYYNKKVSINKLGTFKPHSVYSGDTIKITDDNLVKGLNSMCNYNIHISIADKPLRLILSYLNNSNELQSMVKGDTFHIYKITYKKIKTIEEINQYDIYNAIQDYIYINNEEPNNTNTIIAT